MAGEGPSAGSWSILASHALDDVLSRNAQRLKIKPIAMRGTPDRRRDGLEAARIEGADGSRCSAASG
jgi:hypothetical protein